MTAKSLNRKKTPLAKKRSAEKTRRPYNSPLRQQQASNTLESILTAGVELMQSTLEWDIARLNARAVADHIGISMRTVQRYFPDERNLRDAVMQRTVETSGISLQRLSLDSFSKTTTRMFRYLAALPASPNSTAPVTDPTYAVMDKERRDAVLKAVKKATPKWSDEEQYIAAGALDILWSISSYERLKLSWGMDSESAISGLTWLIDIVSEAVQKNHKPAVLCK